MKRSRIRTVNVGKVLICIGAAALPTVPAAAQAADPTDAIFSAFSGLETPGCAWGYRKGNEASIVRAVGSADLEHGVTLKPESIIEAGSVSKQFTAAAILLLGADGKLALSDDVRRFVPELPEYGSPITIQNLLDHTSGLRDWGVVAEVGGWSRGQRASELSDVLRIISRQRELNHRPGSEYSYTNSGYNLLAIVVQRVSGRSLADYTRDRLFRPIGMNHTSWRDDFRRVVPGRAIAYSKTSAGWAQDMPFENAYGNGGLLTTVGDLMLWNDALDRGLLGDGIAEALAQQTMLTGGQTIRYGRGLSTERYRGMREIGHSGATGGYRAWLARYPERKLSVAVLCPNGSAAAPSLGRQIADVAFALPARNDTPPVAADKAMAGRYVNSTTGIPIEIVLSDAGALSIDGIPLSMIAPGRLAIRDAEISFDGNDHFTLTDRDGVKAFVRAAAFAPDAAELSQFAGRFHSGEGEATYRIEVRDGGLQATLEERPHIVLSLKPSYPDAFVAPDYILRFVRGTDGRVVAATLGTERLRSLRFERIGDPVTREPVGALHRLSGAK